jgi:hypothetical protein
MLGRGAPKKPLNVYDLALKKEEPKRPDNTWIRYSSRQKKLLKNDKEFKALSTGEKSKFLSRSYHTLSPEEHARLEKEYNEEMLVYDERKLQYETMLWVCAQAQDEIQAYKQGRMAQDVLNKICEKHAAEFASKDRKEREAIHLARVRREKKVKNAAKAASAKVNLDLEANFQV